MDALILIVEDEPDQRELLQDLLEHEGYRTIAAASGQEALKAVASECPAIVLVDFTLSDMDGREFVLKARELCKTAPPFVLTTGVHPSKVAGVADVVLYKPLDIDQVLAAVRRLCWTAGAGPAPYSAGDDADTTSVAGNAAIPEDRAGPSSHPRSH